MIEKVNPNIAKQLSKLGINSISDLLFYFPRRYEDFSEMAKISEIQEGQQFSIKGKIIDIKAKPGFRGSVSRAEAVISDDTGSIKVAWFNQPYLANSFKKGDEIFLSGVARYYKGMQLQNPIYEKLNDKQIHTGRIIPIYSISSLIPLRTFRTIVYNNLKYTEKVPEILPKKTIAELGLPTLSETVKNLHFPETIEDLERAKWRIAFEEIFTVQLAVQKHKIMIQKNKAIAVKFTKELISNFVEKLPFILTAEQKKAAWEILQDLEKETPMNRLLEGDVGSGKTLVAFIAALQAASQKNQVSLLCPTEILAQQHYASALKYFKDYKDIELILLTSKKTLLDGENASKKEVLGHIRQGGAQLVISTHAALEKDVEFDKLALVVIDEQHRFGVRQRAALKQKISRYTPHLLSMSATPIPRSLRLTLFGDLQISQIKRLPKGRKKVATKLVNPDDRPKAYGFIREQIKQGRQAFVVTPLIEESDRLGVKAATTEAENLKKIFKEFKVGLLHGKMKTEDKEKVMSDFLDNKVQILVSTSVIEVGVDVPNASVIMIEGADRFGLAQLHQFRGRVGRSEHQSYCFLFTQNPNSTERLEQFSKVTDGFELAELDLKTRGFGNLFGEEQSGFYYFKYFSFADHKDLLIKAESLAKKILEQDPELESNPVLLKRIKDKIIHLE